MEVTRNANAPFVLLIICMVTVCQVYYYVNHFTVFYYYSSGKNRTIEGMGVRFRTNTKTIHIHCTYVTERIPYFEQMVPEIPYVSKEIFSIEKVWLANVLQTP